MPMLILWASLLSKDIKNNAIDDSLNRETQKTSFSPNITQSSRHVNVPLRTSCSLRQHISAVVVVNSGL